MQKLKQQLQALRETLNDDLALRLHRAISWLVASDEHKELDQQFIALSIALSSCYQLQGSEEQSSFSVFAEKLAQYDHDRKIYQLLWHEYSGPVKALIKNPYVFEAFWLAQQDKTINWEDAFDQSSVAALNALSRQQLPELLSVVLERLTVLRNQIFYGGATYSSQLNREQLADAVALLSDLIPEVVRILLANPDVDWGSNAYPPVDNS